MRVSSPWRLKAQYYRLEGCRWSDGSLHFPPRPEPFKLKKEEDLKEEDADETPASELIGDKENEKSV